ncbi:MAG: hypothetical protein J1E28_00460 [Helicobacter sp.]|uniref:hypothetical protein n=1 Tax=Helicobacter sp. TaxID=218 RepID=UPI0025C6BCC3|nr:hypothetical protein [Helicobacter sp.]MCH5312861.1 hypothetical protein [Helicobacter sp.]
MATINYEKYANMTQRQILNSLINAEKQEEKIKKQMQEKLLEKQELIKFLKAKMRESLDKPKQNFIPLHQTESYKQFQEMKTQMTKQELKELEAKVEKEINTDYNDEL